jgi:uncharacterized protein YndB with AHSA1/START domain
LTRWHHDRSDPSADLLLERTVAAPPSLVFAAWTTPKHLVKWFAPAPFTTSECEIDLRPGGIFRAVLRSPEGDEHATIGCYLEISQDERLIWTTALGPGYRPAAPSPRPTFTAVITFAPAEHGTDYSALVMHGDRATHKQHADLGFREGWSTTHDQLVAMFS